MARTVAWAALLACALLCVGIVAVAPLLGDSVPLARWPGMGGIALCVGAAFLLDDDAAATVGATPTSLGRRRLLRVALALPPLAAVWAGSLWYATSADGAWFGPDTRAALSLQLGAMLALTLAASAIALRVMPEEQGGWTGAVVPVAVLGAALALPERWTLLAAPGDGAWSVAQQRWAVLLAIGVLTLVWASREPAAPGGRWGRQPVAHSIRRRAR